MSASLDPEAILAALSETATALVRDDREEADKQIAAIAFRRRAVEKRPSVSPSETARVFRRDHFTCCYCGQRTIPSVVMRCFSTLWPKQFPYHPHGKTSEAHFAYWTIMSSLEHLEAGTRGGDWTADVNLACACWTCNQTKGNAARTGNFAGYAEPDRNWDGLTGLYPELWMLAGRPDPAAHGKWLRAWHGEVP